MRTILILAGQSKRFWPLREKPLFRLHGKTLAEHLVDRLKGVGLSDITLVVSKNNKEEISAIFPDLTIVEQQDLSLGMKGAFLDALPSAGSDPVLLVGGTDFMDPSAYLDTANMLKDDAVNGAVLAYKVDHYFPGGYLTLGDGDRITGIVEKPGPGNEPSDLVNIVVHAHRDASVLLEALQSVSSDSDDEYEVALQTLFENRDYRAVPYSRQWQAVKYPWHLLLLNELLLQDLSNQTIHSSASIHPSAVVEGPVILEEGVRILPHATVLGPCYIGKNSLVGNNALVRGSSIGENCVVGYNTEVKSSIFSNHVWTHSTYVGDSVIGHNVSFGAGSVTGNLRLDEGEIYSEVKEEPVNTGLKKFGTIIGDHCRIGIHTGINPGIKIGPHCFVAGRATVHNDVPDSSFVTMKDGKMHVRENKQRAPLPEEREGFRKKL